MSSSFWIANACRSGPIDVHASHCVDNAAVDNCIAVAAGTVSIGIVLEIIGRKSHDLHIYRDKILSHF